MCWMSAGSKNGLYVKESHTRRMFLDDCGVGVGDSAACNGGWLLPLDVLCGPGVGYRSYLRRILFYAR